MNFSIYVNNKDLTDVPEKPISVKHGEINSSILDQQSVVLQEVEWYEETT